MRDQQRKVDTAEWKISRGVHGDHARHLAGGAHIDRRYSRVSVRRADEAALERSFVYVVGVPTSTAKQAVVLHSLDACAEPASGHFLLSSAARTTARRIDAYPVQRHRLPAIPSSIS